MCKRQNVYILHIKLLTLGFDFAILNMLGRVLRSFFAPWDKRGLSLAP